MSQRPTKTLPLTWSGSAWTLNTASLHRHLLDRLQDVGCTLHRCWTPFGERVRISYAVRDAGGHPVLTGSCLGEPGFSNWSAIQQAAAAGSLSLHWTHDDSRLASVPVVIASETGPPGITATEHLRMSVPNPLHRYMPMFLTEDQVPAPSISDDDLRQQIALHALSEEICWRGAIQQMSMPAAIEETDSIIATYVAYARGAMELTTLLTRRWGWLQANEASSRLRLAVLTALRLELDGVHAALMHDASLIHDLRALTSGTDRVPSALLPWADLTPFARVDPDRTGIDLMTDWVAFDAQAVTAHLYLGDPALEVLRTHLAEHPNHELTYSGLPFRAYWRAGGSPPVPADQVRKAGGTLIRDALANRRYAIDAGSIVELPDPLIPRLHLSEIPQGIVAILEGHPRQGRTPVSVMRISWDADGGLVDHVWSIDVDDHELDIHYQTVVAAVVRDLMVLEMRPHLGKRRAGFVLRRMRHNHHPLYVYLARRSAAASGDEGHGSDAAPADPPPASMRGLAATDDESLRADGVLQSRHIRPHLHRLPEGHRRSAAAHDFILANVPWVPHTATFNRGATAESGAPDADGPADERERIFRSRSATACILERLGRHAEDLLRGTPDRHEPQRHDWRIDQALIARLMQQGGVADVRIRPHPDGGIDVDGTADGVPVLVQVKSRKKLDWTSVIRDLAGAVQRAAPGTGRIAILVSCNALPHPAALEHGALAGIRVCHVVDFPQILASAVKRLARSARAT